MGSSGRYAPSRCRADPSSRYSANVSDDQRPAEHSTATSFDSQYLTAVLESVPAFVIRLDADLRIRYINRLQPGFRLEDVLGRSTFDFVDPVYRDMHRETIERAREGMVASAYTIAGQGADGKPAYYESRVVPLREPDGSIGVTIIAVEITEHVLRGEALAASEEKLRLAVEATGVGLWSWDVASDKVEWSEAMFEIMGGEGPYTPREYLDKIVHPEDRAAVAAEVARVPDDTHRHIEHRVVRPDGQVRHIVSRSTTVLDEDGSVARLYGGTMDVTEARVLQEQLQQVQKLDAIGSLTAGVAHNFNNMLSVIIPALELLGATAPVDEAEVVDDALHAANRAAELVEQLMTFAGQSRPQARSTFALDTLAERVTDMCRRTFDRNIQVTFVGPDEHVHVEASATKIEQVLVNLLINARDAVRAADGASGLIRVLVDATDGELLADRVDTEAAAPGRYARLRVIDSGVGMTTEQRSRLFEPFFTTKAFGRGTGLGLATSYAIVREHGGVIECTSEPTRGSEFHVYLPAVVVEDSPAVDRAHDMAAGPPAPRRGHVLLVDDEAGVRRMTRQLLEREGVRVTPAGSTAEAVALLRAGCRPNVILLDRSMPDGDGIAAVPDLRRHGGDVRILLFTGQEVSADEQALADGVLAKPVTVAKLRALLDASLGDGADVGAAE